MKPSFFATLFVTCVAALAAKAGELPAPIATRQNSFVIPFKVSQSPQGKAQPAEVELHVSEDQGGLWRIHNTLRASERGFKFRAEQDGEYWFAVRTRDKSGTVRPAGPLAPELRVVVDTQPPTLELTAEAGPDGEITARLRLGDPNLARDSLKLEYHADESAEAWQTVAIQPIPADTAGPNHFGEVTWWPQRTTRSYSIRAEVADTAGNPAVKQTTVLARVVAARDEGTDADLVSESSAPPQDVAASPPPDKVETTDWPADETVDDPLGSSGSSASERANGRTPREQTIAPPVGNRYSALPPRVQPRMVNSTRFRLDYDVESVGPWGVRKVELWGTRDEGRTWVSYGLDDDNQSPLLAAVEGEGTYGFRVLVESGSGLVQSPPESGERPEIWIGVDLTQPVCRLMKVEQGAGERAGQLIIHWEADDAWPAERPISLAFSENPNGPWSSIAAGLRNTGRYVWRLDERAPDQVYLRLEARDAAGNVAVSQPAEAYTVAPLRPRGRIKDVQPLDSAAIRPKIYRF